MKLMQTIMQMRRKTMSNSQQKYYRDRMYESQKRADEISKIKAEGIEEMRDNWFKVMHKHSSFESYMNHWILKLKKGI